MREITRDIVGGVIVAADGKVLLGHNVKGGVFDDKWVVPGGGVEEGETKEVALQREMLEETGIDISDAVATPFETTFSASAEKTLRDTGERVLVHMTFYDFIIRLQRNSTEVPIKSGDDYQDGQWFSAQQLATLELAHPTRRRLVEGGFFDGGK